jgi:hypothetical protein
MMISWVYLLIIFIFRIIIVIGFIIKMLVK